MEWLNVKSEKSILQHLREFIGKLNSIFPEGELYSTTTDWENGLCVIKVYISNYKSVNVRNEWRDIYIKRYRITESKLMEFLEHAD